MSRRDIEGSLEGFFTGASEPEETVESPPEGGFDDLLKVLLAQIEAAQVEPKPPPPPPPSVVQAPETHITTTESVYREEPIPTATPDPGISLDAALAEQRSGILNLFLRGLSVIGAVGIVALLITAVQDPSQIVPYIPFLGAYAVLVGLTLATKLDNRWRTAVVVVLAYSAGCLSVATDGPWSLGTLYLLLPPLLLSIVTGQRAGVISAVSSAVVYTAFVAAFSLGWFRSTQATEFAGWPSVLNLSGTFAVIVVGVTLILWMLNSYLVSSLQKALGQQKEAVSQPAPRVEPAISAAPLDSYVPSAVSLTSRKQPGRIEALRRAVAQLRIKLTLPYALLALAITFAMAVLVTRNLIGLLEDRFQTALIDSGRMATDMVVQIEREQLAAWRSVAYTEGFAESVAEGDADTVAQLAAPHVLNARMDCADILDSSGSPLLALHHQRGGRVDEYITDPGTEYADWEIVQQVLAGEVDESGDKFADLIETDWGWVFYTAGPILHEEDIVGVLLTGTYIDHLVQRLDGAALARVSIYVEEGSPLATTLAFEPIEVPNVDEETYQAVVDGQAEQTVRRNIMAAGREYAEVLGVFEARHGNDLGMLSVAIPLSWVTDARAPTRVDLLTLFGVMIALILVIGTLVASIVLRPVQQLAAATQRVARGDLQTQVEMRGHDEVAALASDFNDMIIQLREGRLYHDLLGLTSSPEVAERLRQVVETGGPQLQAQTATATVLFIDIRDFTQLAEGRDPSYILGFLNDYLQGLVRIIRKYNGVVNKFVGDAALAFFGILPEIVPPADSARSAIAAALEIESYLKDFNRQRFAQGEEQLRIGAGINTGEVVAGTVGSDQRLEYTILGDTVNVAQRLSDLSKTYPQFELFLSAETYRYAGDGLDFKVTHLGNLGVKGRAAPVNVFAVRGS
jgi:adenylate cyclase